MNEINPKLIEFDEQLLENVALFDEVLHKLGEPPLFENQNFTAYSSPGIHPRYLVIETTNKKSNPLPIMIWFEGEDLRIDIDHIPETFDWAKQQIDEDRNAVIEFVRNLFTGYLLIDYRGNSARFVQMFDADGDFLMSFSRNVLLHMFGKYLLRQKDYRKLFLPLFERTK